MTKASLLLMPGRPSSRLLWVIKPKVPQSIIRWHSHITHLKQCSQYTVSLVLLRSNQYFLLHFLMLVPFVLDF